MSKNYKKMKKGFKASNPFLVNGDSLGTNYFHQKHVVEKLNIDALKVLLVIFSVPDLWVKHLSPKEFLLIKDGSGAEESFCIFL